MKILGIETSCDETALAIVEGSGGLENPSIRVVAEELYSQASLHAEFGGVYPNLAKREHAKNLVPLLKKLLTDGANTHQSSSVANDVSGKLRTIFSHEPELFDMFVSEIFHLPIPDIDAIAVTQGPGLEPALWVGINFAKALSLVWKKPLVPVNHLEGHVASVLLNKNESLVASRQSPRQIVFPAIVLLVSGGHTDLISMKNWFEYEHMGGTRDDAAGEAFDKSARLLGIPYPGGPHISRLAEEAREQGLETDTPLPRPMIQSRTLDMSFSGLKTAVLYRIKEQFGSAEEMTEEDKKKLSREVEDAVVEVLVSKTSEAVERTSPQTLIAAGGVMANKVLRVRLEELVAKYNISLAIPPLAYATDNAVMIATAGYLRALKETPSFTSDFDARGTLPLSD